MNRLITYPGAIPLDTDLLYTNKYAMIGLGWLAQACLGTSTVVDGFTCIQQAAPNLTVQLTAGAIYTYTSTDASAYGSLALDTTHSLVKQGLLLDTVNLACAAPGTSGQSINYLIQVQFSETDGGSTVLPYYNAANPSVAYSGPGGAGTSNFTVRQGGVAYSAKAGTAAATGSQVTPTPDAGYTGLFVVTVAFGQTQILNSNITQYAAAPFLFAKLGTIPQLIQNQTVTAFADSGTANALVITPLPAVSAYSAYQRFTIKKSAAANTTTTPTLNVSGLGAKTLVRADGTALVAGDLPASCVFDAVYDGTSFRVVSGGLPQSVINIVNNKPLFGLVALPATTFNVAGGGVSVTVSTYGTVTNNFSTSTFSSGILTIGTGEDGWYLISGWLGTNLAVPGTSSTLNPYGWVQAIGLSTDGGSTYPSVGGSSNGGNGGMVTGPFSAGSVVRKLNVGDKVLQSFAQNSSQTQNSPCGFSVIFLGK